MAYLNTDQVFGEKRTVIDEYAELMTHYRRWQARDAARRQDRLMRVRGTVTVRRDAKCVPTMVIDPYVYHQLGQQFGYAVWDDPKFVDYVARSMPCKPVVKVEGASVTNAWTSPKKKFSKSYGEI
jgi:hypothetical protein